MRKLTPQVAVNARGDALIAWDAGTDIQAVLAPLGQPWGSPVVLSRARGLRGSTSYPQVTLDARGNAQVAWVFDDTQFYGKSSVRRDVYATRFTVSTATWSTPELVGLRQGSNAHTDYRLRLDPYGNAWVLWRQDRVLGDSSTTDGYLNRYAVPQPSN